MAPIPPDRFARLLRGLSSDDFERFVADLWRARGWDVRTEPGTIVAKDPGSGATRRLRIRHDSGWLGRPAGASSEAPDADATVTNVRGSDAGGRVIDADELRDVLLYAVDRDRGDELARRYFGRTLAATEPRFDPPSIDAVWGRVSTDRRRSPSGSTGTRYRSLFAALGVIVLLGTILGAGSGQVALDPAGPETPDPTDVTPVDPPETAAAGGATTVLQPERGGGVASEIIGPLPPGLSRDGIADHREVADAHARAVTGRSYRLEITYREFVDSRPSAVRWERVRVESPTVYVSDVGGVGAVARIPNEIATVSAYANGSVRYERRAALYDSVAFEQSDRYRRRPVTLRRNGEGRYADRVETYVGWFLSVRESAVTSSFVGHGKTYYWVTFTGDPWQGVENTTGYALVDSTGIVHEMQRRYDVPGQDGVSAVVTVRYTGVGATSVDPPLWVRAMRNRSAG